MEKINFNENTIFIQDWFLFDPEDWGASMEDFKWGKTRTELAKKNLHVEGSPAAELQETFYVSNEPCGEYGYPPRDSWVEIPKKLWEEKIPA